MNQIESTSIALSQTSSEDKPNRINTLQHLRAVAALSVLLYHASYYTNLYTNIQSFLVTFGGGFGTFGVLIFFALSGYLMAQQAAKMRGQPVLFMIHRLIRIYPIFWIACLIRIAVGCVLGSGQFDPLVLMLSPVGQRDYPLGVEWTLVYELAFYLFVSIVLFVRLERWIGLIGALWLAAIIGRTCAFGWYAPQFTTSLLAIPMSAVCGAFAAGLVVPNLIHRGWIGPSALPIGAFTIALAGYPHLVMFSQIIVGIGCAVIVGWAACLAQQASRSPVMSKLGDWSYATYLIHVPILITLGIVAARINQLDFKVKMIELWIGMIILVLIATPIFGSFDIALHKNLRRFVNKLNTRTQAVVLGVFAGGFCLCMALSAAQDREEAKAFDLAASPGDSVIADLENAGWHEDNRLAGNIEPLARGGGITYISGWVNDTQDMINRASVLFVIDRQTFLAVPRSYRFDIIKAFGLLRSLAPTSFRRSLPGAACPIGTTVQAFALSPRDKLYHTLGTSVCP